jgi:predicted Zn finger-like uncharacterized protein
MDVRCEKCQTEYELDESRLKPTGVTVKCTNCGHMFKIRKKGSTNLGPMAPNPLSVVAPLPRAKPVTVPPAPPSADRSVRASTQPANQSASSSGEARTWLLRLESGESRSCKELATLQQWILAGEVNRESLISRNGKTWKRLGDIAALGSYFVISDEAKANRRGAANATLIGVVGNPISAPQATEVDLASVRASSSLPLPADTETDEDMITTGERHAPNNSTTAKTPPLGAPVGNRVAAPPVPVRSQHESTEKNTAPPAARRAPTLPPPPPPTTNRATAGWATNASSHDGANKVAAVAATESGFSGAAKGPATGGFSGRVGAVSNEPAFTNGPTINSASASFAGKIRTEPGNDDVFRNAPQTVDDDETGPVYAPRSSSAGKWIAIGSILVIGGAAAAIYFGVLRNGGSKSTTPDTSAALLGSNSGSNGSNGSNAVLSAIPDAAGPTTQPLTSPLSEAVDAARADLAGDLHDRLKSRAEALAKLDEPLRNDPAVLSVRSRVATALAQQLEDQAALADSPSAADGFRKQSKDLVTTAIGWATKAVKQTPSDAAAMVAMADVLRLQAKPARDVRKYLSAPVAGSVSESDIQFVAALLTARDGKLADARKALAALDVGSARLEQSGDVRLRFRQAMMAFADGKASEARPILDSVLASQPAHEGALALLAKLNAAVSTSDPLPPENNGSGASGSATAPNPGNPSVTPDAGGQRTPTGVEDYDHLVKRANDYAETSCGKATELFNKALEQKPNGVEALVGLGFCSLDSKNYATAFSKFRAALAISPRNERALWGVAETYQQQSRKDQAIESYQRYLEVYPDSSAAKKQLERLGVGDTATKPPTPAVDTPKDPPKDPTPPVKDPPAIEPSPSGQPTKPTE